MRFIGFLFLLAGLAAAFGYPYYYQNYTNFTIGTYKIFDKELGFRDLDVALSPADSPIDIEFQALADTVEVAGGSDTAFAVTMASPSQSLLNKETIRFSGPMGDTAADTTSAIEMNVARRNMAIKEDANYTFYFVAGDVNEIPLATISMTVKGLVLPYNQQVSTIGYGAAALGAMLVFFGGGAKRRRVGNAPMGKTSKASRIGRRADPEPPKSKAPEKPKHKWGRDA